MQRKRRVSRRRFLTEVTAGAFLSGVASESLAQPSKEKERSSAPSKEGMPMGRIGNQQFSRLMLGGNLISGYAHARGLRYVRDLMLRYNTEAKILETLEIAESHGINAINLAIWDDISFLQKHWKNGGKMKLIAQALPGPKGELDQFKKAVDMGAVAVHIQGHGAEKLWEKGQIDLIAKVIDYLKSQKVIAGVASHALEVIVACEEAGLAPDFYQKTLHPTDYCLGPQPGETGYFGKCDNWWCNNPEEVVEFMHTVKKPWIAFKVMAAGAIHPRRAFSYAFNSGADFILAGMFDWQIAEDVKYLKEALQHLQRLRPWYS